MWGAPITRKQLGSQYRWRSVPVGGALNPDLRGRIEMSKDTEDRRVGRAPPHTADDGDPETVREDDPESGLLRVWIPGRSPRQDRPTRTEAEKRTGASGSSYGPPLEDEADRRFRERSVGSETRYPPGHSRRRSDLAAVGGRAEHVGRSEHPAASGGHDAAGGLLVGTAGDLRQPQSVRAGAQPPAAEWTAANTRLPPRDGAGDHPGGPPDGREPTPPATMPTGQRVPRQSSPSPVSGPSEGSSSGGTASAGGRPAESGLSPRPADAAGDGTQSGAAALDSERLLDENRPPAGWRGVVWRLTGGRVRLAPSARERRRRRLEARIATPVTEPHHIAVVSRKGGVGKTTTAVMLGHVLATHRGDRVLAVDGNPDGGSLAYRVARETEGTVSDVLARCSPGSPYARLRAYTSQSDSRLEVLAADDNPSISAPLDQQAYTRLLEICDWHYNLVVVDTAPRLLDGGIRGILARADQLVVVCPPAVDGARVAAGTLDWLEQHGYAELASRAVAVINGVRPDAPVNVDELEAHFAGRCRAVVRVPWDGHLSSGGRASLGALHDNTRGAYEQLAAAVADQFHAPQPESRRSPAGWAASVPALEPAQERTPDAAVTGTDGRPGVLEPGAGGSVPAGGRQTAPAGRTGRPPAATRRPSPMPAQRPPDRPDSPADPDAPAAGERPAGSDRRPFTTLPTADTPRGSPVPRMRHRRRRPPGGPPPEPSSGS